MRVTESDEQYYGIEIRVWNERYCATTFIYLADCALSEFGAAIAGFPQSHEDERSWVFGSRDPRIGGGFCRLRFFSHSGSQMIEVHIADDARFSDAKAEFMVPVEASWVDRFVESLATVERDRAGDALLAPSA